MKFFSNFESFRNFNKFGLNENGIEQHKCCRCWFVYTIIW